MPSPFPGMDPYLEQPIFWSEFHSRLIVAIADALAPSLLPRYYVGVETRTYWDSTDEALLVGVADAIVQGIYDRGGYSIRIDYQQPVPPPALSADNQLWVNQLLRNASIIA